MNGQRPRLDDLLAHLPLPALPQATAKEPRERDSARWAKQLERTLARVHAESNASHSHPRADRVQPEFELNDVLRTPLPLEPHEPDPNQLGLDGRSAPPSESFDGIFAGEALDSDPLRAPLKSGEHAHFRPAFVPAPNAHDLDSTTPLKPRSRLVLVLGGATTFLAAAAAVAFYVRTERKEAPPLADTMASLNAEGVVTAPSQPQSKTANDTPAVVAPVGAEHRNAVAVAEAKAVAPSSAIVSVPRAAKPTAGKSANGIPPRSAAFAGEEVTGAAPRDEPVLSPAAGPNEVADHPALGAIVSAYSKKQAEAKRCLPPDVTGVHVTLTFGSEGNVTRVAVQPSNLDPTAQACIKTALRSVQVAPFARKQYEVTLAL